MGRWRWGWVMVLVLSWLGSVHMVRAQEIPFPCSEAGLIQLVNMLQQQGTLTVTGTESQVHICLEQYRTVWQSRTSFSDIQVDLRDGFVRVILRRNFYAFYIDLAPRLDQGRVFLEVRGIRLGFLPVPAFLYQDQVRTINADLARLYATDPVLSHVRVTQFRLTDTDFAVTLQWTP